MADGPLTGFRIFDLTRVLAGPYCTALLADLGAEVIKVEPPEGDEYRHIGPFVSGESALFQLVNRGKKSITLDLKDEAQRLLARQLALSCDCVVENFRPGVSAKFGLDAEACVPKNLLLSMPRFPVSARTDPGPACPPMTL